MKTSLLATGFTALSLMLPMGASAASFSKLYIFGDSLSDPGNIFNATTFANNPSIPLPIPPDTEIPPVDPLVPPYDDEGRFSDGLVWADYLAQDLGLDIKASTNLSVLKPGSSIRSPITFDPITEQPIISPFFNGATTTNSVNFAFGAAQTGELGSGVGIGDDFTELVPGVLTQVSWFVNDHTQAQQQADDQALYVVWAGPNDYQTVPNANPAQSVANLTLALESLYTIGARNFLIPNLPDLGKTPRALTPFAVVDSQTLTQRTIEHNALLSNAFGDLNQSDTDINLISFDTFSLFNEIRANPTEFGFSNVTEACLNPDPKTFPVEEPTTIEVCQDPSKYVFWDGIHPTTAAHNLLAKRFQLRLEKKSESVNEPNFSAALGLLSITWLVRFIFNFINKKSLKP